ncbi:GNAT family N-acetyltransferase [Ascidiimonas sp. W6]|uniref:GNAT family N-acetyltransferase n=1 Tax=Ascidiimonas meishanensis TaxID=3128903 RepID=UPI0030ED04E5
MNTTQHILFTCAGRRNYLINYFKEALNGKGQIFACDKDATAPALKDADKAFIVPSIYHSSYISSLIKLIKDYQITAIISLNDLELPILSKNRAILEKAGARLLISDEHAIQITFDKWETYQFLVTNGFKTPKTFLEFNLAVKAIKEGSISFPVVVKPRWGSASINVDIAENQEELELIYKLQSLKIKRSILREASKFDLKKAIIIQEKLIGKEYGLDVLNDFDQNFCATFAKRKLSMRGGETDKAQTIIDQRFEIVGKKLGEALKHIGNMDCDVFLCNEEVFVLELNPRFGGGYPFSHEAGANIPAIYLQWLNDSKDVQHLNLYKEGILFSKCDRLIEILNPMNINWELTVEEINSEYELEHYQELLSTINCDNPFYKIRVSDAYTKNQGDRSFYFIFKKNGHPIIVMPFFLRKIEIDNEVMPYYDVSSPYGYSGPSFSPDLPKIYLAEFWQKVDQWYLENNVVSEFIRFSLDENHLHYTGTLIPTLKNVKGIIKNEEEQWNDLKPKARNNYRKALQQGLRIEVFHEKIPAVVIEDFYNIYIKTMVRNKADQRYFYELEYFKSIITENADACAIAVIYKDKTPISTELILISQNTLYSFLGGTLNEYFYCRPNDFLKLEIMNWARMQEKSFYILGGGREDGDGLYKYKKSFFPHDEDVIYYTGRKIINSEIYNELVMKKNVTDIEVITDTIELYYFPLYRS